MLNQLNTQSTDIKIDLISDKNVYKEIINNCYLMYRHKK